MRELVLPSGEPKAEPRNALSVEVAQTLDTDELLALGYACAPDSSGHADGAGRDRIGFI
ncbi:MAG: hypothetical protein M9921_01115 [Fimbriimonadaceae bacterium]|nr:hypothetical protein [Fimbriimonadaceae bacterium]